MNLKTKRILMAFIGVVVTGISIGMFQSSALGTDPFTSFTTGLCNVTGLPFGVFYTILCACILVIVFILDKYSFSESYILLISSFSLSISLGSIFGSFVVEFSVLSLEKV